MAAAAVVLAATMVAPAGAWAGVQQITAANTHTCAIKTDGTPVCWGSNSSGESTIPLGTGTVTAITASRYHTCAIRSDGTPACWGRNNAGQTTIPPGTGTVTAIAAGWGRTCAIKADGTPVCWPPTTIPAGTGAVAAITAGGSHACAIKTDGTPTCWGDNGVGQSAVPPGTGTVSAISAGGSYTCAIKTDGTPVCWGNNNFGQSTVPPDTGRVSAVATGYAHTCVIGMDGNPVCWGRNQEGQTTVPAGTGPLTAISAGSYHTCAIRSDLIAVCWGGRDANWWGQLGAAPRVPSPIPPGAQLRTSYRHAFTSGTGAPRGAFAVTAGALPPGLELSASGALSGAPTTLGRYRFTVTADNGIFAPAHRGFTIRVVRPPITGLPVADNPSVIVVGRPQPGRTLIATTGTWSAKPTQFAYQWKRCDADGNGCEIIAGATGKSIVLGQDDVGHRLRAEVLATNELGTSLRPAIGHPSVTVASARASELTFPLRRPLISGDPQSGQTLTVAAGRWSGNPPLSVQWRRCELGGRGCIDIPSATATTLQLSNADVAHRLRVVVTATTAGGPVAYQTHPTAPVGLPFDTAPATISGMVP